MLHKYHVQKLVPLLELVPFAVPKTELDVVGKIHLTISTFRRCSSNSVYDKSIRMSAMKDAAS